MVVGSWCAAFSYRVGTFQRRLELEREGRRSAELDRKSDVARGLTVPEEAPNLVDGVAGDAGADLRNPEGEVGMVVGVLVQVVDVETDDLETVHGWNSVGLSLPSDPLAEDGTEAVDGVFGGPSPVNALEVGSEDEDVVGAEFVDPVRGEGNHWSPSPPVDLLGLE